MMQYLIYLITHEYAIGIIVILLATFLFSKNRRLEALEILSASFLVAAVGVILKMIWKVPRPGDATILLDSYAYPSIHAAWIASVCALIYIFWIRKLHKKRMVIIYDIILVVMILSIGGSRVVLGVHGVDDVVGGYAFGIIVALLVFIGFRLAEWYRS